MKKYIKILFVLFYILFFNNMSCQNYADSLNYYMKKSDFNKAAFFGEIIKDDLIKHNDNKNLAVISSNLGIFYYSLGNYHRAEICFNKALKLEEEINGKENINYAIIQKHTAKNYKELGNYLEAKKIINEALIIFKSKLGESHPDYADALNVLGTIYNAQENYKLSIPLFEKSTEIFKNKFGENEIYASPLLSLGYTYFLLGEYDKAESIIIKSVNIFKKYNEKNKSNYAMSLYYLADIYIIKGQFANAEKCLVEAGEILKIDGEQSPKYIQILSKIGYLYLEDKSYDNAEIILKKCIELTEKTSGIKNANTLANKNNLSLVYLKTVRLNEAENLNKEVLSLTKELYGTSNRKYLNTLNNQALIFYQLKKYRESEESYKEALKISKYIYGENHPEYLHLLENISLMYIGYSKPLEASICINQLFHPFQKQISNASNYLSENELSFYNKEVFQKRFFPLSFLQSYPTQYPEINIGCYENELLVKNLSLRNQQRIKTSIEKSDDALLKNKYQQFVDNKRQLTKLEELPIAKRSQDYESLKTTTEVIEKDLTRQSSVFADAKKSLSITWKAVQDKLQSNEVAIDIVAYNYNVKKWTDSIVYAAFVIGKDFKTPKYIPLFEQKQLKLLIERNSKEDDTLQAKKLNKQYSNKAISDLFFKPLEKELEGKTTLYLSPAGLGYQIDFSALPVSETQTLGEKYQVHVLGSTADLVSYSSAQLDKTKSIELLLYGGINYSKSHPNAEKKQELIEDNNAIADLRTRSGISGFAYLPGTNDEVKKIAQLGKESGFVSTILNKEDATEESIKQLDGRTTPYVLHLATHGFFFADPKQELPKENLLSDSKATIYKTADDPMMRSGLLFAGANKYWNTTTENLTTDDGILTANEISNLDLSACQLVVLSACETGLGTINGSEGVFGLQRAFKMAGVKNIIMSLWKVPDSQTAELFSVFYKECLGGTSIHEAFQFAQAKMRVKYSPYYWAGFVLLE